MNCNLYQYQKESEMVCVLDIESVPDTHLLCAKFDLQPELNELEICRQAFALQKEKSGSEFLPIPFHRVLCISSVLCDEFGSVIKIGNFGKKAKQTFLENLQSQQNLISKELLDSYESALLADFWEFFNKKQPSLVSFNGRGFDLIVLTLRCMRYNISANALFEIENPQHNKTKWENYRSRYSERFHTDLFESLGNFGSVRNLNLDTLCQMSGIVGKYDMNGAQVYECFFGSDDKNTALERIESYCQSDVLNTYWLYLKYLILKGELLKNDYARLLDELIQKLPQTQEYYAAFSAQIKQELESLS